MFKVGFIGLRWDLSLHKRPQPHYFVMGLLQFILAACVTYFVFIR